MVLEFLVSLFLSFCNISDFRTIFYMFSNSLLLFGGAILFAFIASFGAYFLFGEKIPLITPLHASILAVALALVAVLGDLAESILKRSLEAKDSGHKMPGIGGVLDLIDSVLFTAPILYVYLLIIS